MKSIHIHWIVNIILIINYKVMRNSVQNAKTLQTFLNLNAVFGIIDNLFNMFLSNFSWFIRCFGRNGNTSISKLSPNMFSGDIAIDIIGRGFSFFFRCRNCFCYTTGKCLNIFNNSTFNAFGRIFA